MHGKQMEINRKYIGNKWTMIEKQMENKLTITGNTWKMNGNKLKISGK